MVSYNFTRIFVHPKGAVFSSGMSQALEAHNPGSLPNGLKEKFTWSHMASPKIPWYSLWTGTWRMIPEPETNSRPLIAPDDFLNPKAGGGMKHFQETSDLYLSGRKTGNVED